MESTDKDKIQFDRHIALSQKCEARRAFKEIIADSRATPAERLQAIEGLKEMRRADWEARKLYVGACGNREAQMKWIQANRSKKVPKATKDAVSRLLEKIDKL